VGWAGSRPCTARGLLGASRACVYFVEGEMHTPYTADAGLPLVVWGWEPGGLALHSEGVLPPLCLASLCGGCAYLDSSSCLCRDVFLAFETFHLESGKGRRRGLQWRKPVALWCLWQPPYSISSRPHCAAPGLALAQGPFLLWPNALSTQRLSWEETGPASAHDMLRDCPQADSGRWQPAVGVPASCASSRQLYDSCVTAV